MPHYDLIEVAVSYGVSPNLIRKLIKQHLVNPILTRNPRRVKKYLFSTEDLYKLEKVLLKRGLLDREEALDGDSN